VSFPTTTEKTSRRAHKNLDKVSKIVAKNRALDDLNLKLFLDVGHREIKLYDWVR
jgi:hypothetical protein